MNKDRELLRQLKNDDSHALEILYHQYWEFLFNSAHNLLQDQHICEEIVQDVFIALWEKRRELEIESSLKAYLYGVMRYKVFSHLRSPYAKMHLHTSGVPADAPQEITPENHLLYSELDNFISKVISELPDKCREVFRLSRQEQLSHKEISVKMNISVKTVENHINKALGVIRSALKSSATIIAILAINALR